jgi:hypothetical protein
MTAPEATKLHQSKKKIKVLECRFNHSVDFSVVILLPSETPTVQFIRLAFSAWHIAIKKTFHVCSAITFPGSKKQV